MATDNSLLGKLASVLPQGYKFGVHHISTAPTKTEPLCSAPPGERDDKTYGESHFLAVSIDSRESGSKRASPGADDAKEAGPRRPVLVFAIEVFIFTTAWQTTFFVSKADSTGYLQLLDLPKGTPSPIREVASTFLKYLLEHRRRKNIQSVVNLFARSQAQYLFPGSIENKGKHVLDDWGLVRWWCRVLNPLLEGSKSRPWGSSKGYLMVPGLEVGEMRALTPRTQDSAANWIIGQPLDKISHYVAEYDWVPLRCLIPRYPDDPKSRFRDELDEEASKWKQDMGYWKSVKTLDQFWEMMAYRQECSSGRLTGFVWLVFDPEAKKEEGPQVITPNASFCSPLPGPQATPPRRRTDIAGQTPQTASPLKQSLTPSKFTETPATQKKKKKPLSGPITARPPRVKTEHRKQAKPRPTRTPYFYWPEEGRGDRVVEESDFKRIVEHLLQLDFSTLEKATASTRRWISEAAMGAKWGKEITGKRMPALNFGLASRSKGTGLFGDIPALGPSLANGTGASEGLKTGGVNTLNASLVRKKAKTEDSGRSLSGALDSDDVFGVKDEKPAVNVLGAGLIRKKPKTEAAADVSEPSAQAQGPQVNVLGAGLIRKKPKPA
ncbi:histone acetylation protein-domain-containing protein [Podospora aff. communis PSN243]|uniref:histone acetyltransferase n=1 Tax=Podospora aff. communis PSN243 TaxID=3040156 RepID=A0AAV9G3Z0_9PEZI|nr:histone acetylation protein-domain-containing protein [Podospora aff. communis PSN243]